MTKFKTNKKVSAFKGVAVLIIAAILALIFTGCPQSGGGSGGSENIEGVWKVVSEQKNNDSPIDYPKPNDDGSKGQLYLCFWEGKAYFAIEITKNLDPVKNGLFKSPIWDKDYTFANGILTVDGGHVSFSITGNEAAISMTVMGETVVVRLTRVSSPTVEEIKAAK